MVFVGFPLKVLKDDVGFLFLVSPLAAGVGSHAIHTPIMTKPIPAQGNQKMINIFFIMKIVIYDRV